MLSHAAATYVANHEVQIFSSAVIATVDNQGYLDAVRLHDAGVQVQGIYDARSDAAGPSVNAAKAAGIAVRFRATVLDTRPNAEGA
jgi:sarcosine oxidase subunit alpha